LAEVAPASAGDPFAEVNQQVMILVFGDKWQDEVSRFASR